MKPKDSALIVRHNNLIEGRIPISTQEKRLFLWLLSEINPSDSHFIRYRVNIKDLAEFIRIDKNKNIYKEVWQVAQKLMSRSVELRDIEKNEMIQTYLVTGAKYEIGKGYIELEIGSYLKPYLLQLKANFTTISLKYAMMLKTAYSMTIYDLLKQYQTIGKRRIEIDELKKILGISPDQYQNFNDFKKRILEPSKEDINSKTDLEFLYEEAKEGKKVIAVTFVILKKSDDFNDEALIEISDTNYEKIKQRIIEHGIKTAVADKLMEDFYLSDPHRIMWCLEEVEKQARQGKIKTTGAWLTKAIQEDYRPQRNLFAENIEAESNKIESAKKTAQNKKMKISVLEDLKNENDRKYMHFRRDKLIAYLETLSDVEYAEFEKQAKPHIGFGLDSFRKAKTLQDKWSGIFAVMAAMEVLDKSKLDIPNLEEWLSSSGLETIAEIDAKIAALKGK